MTRHQDVTLGARGSPKGLLDPLDVLGLPAEVLAFSGAGKVGHTPPYIMHR